MKQGSFWECEYLYRAESQHCRGNNTITTEGLEVVRSWWSHVVVLSPFRCFPPCFRSAFFANLQTARGSLNHAVGVANVFRLFLVIISSLAGSVPPVPFPTSTPVATLRMPVQIPPFPVHTSRL